MIFSNIDFTLKYLDPSAETAGDGSSPETPLNAFPTTIAEMGNNTAWVIRRTAEDKSALLPNGNTSDIQNILFIGMPLKTDPMWSMMPLIAQEAWGEDEAQYANIRADTGTEPWGDEYGFILSAGKTFLLHRIYLFRDNTPAYVSIFKFPAQDYTASISIENCKFGLKGLNLDDSTCTTATSTSYCKAYFYINTAHVLSMHHCIMNFVDGGDDYYGDTYNPFHINNASYISVSDIDIYTTTSQYGGYYGPSGTALCFSNGSWGGAFTDYQNLRFHILVNGTWGYMPSLFYSAVNDYCRIKNISAVIEDRKLGTDTPSQFCLGQSVIRSHGSREFEIDGITVKLPKCWRVTESGRAVSISGFCNSTIPGHQKSVKNITVEMAETDGIDSENTSGNYYDWVKYGTSDLGQYPYFSALELSFSERSYSEGSWEPVAVSQISVKHPHGVAMYAYGCQIRNCALKGTVKLRRCVCDVSTLDTFYPGYALFAAEASTLRVSTLTLGKENAEITGGADDPAVGSRYEDSSFIYVNTSNGALKSNTGGTATNVWNGYNFICGNEIDGGHYTCRSINYICDTWNAHRTGGSPAVLKFTTSANGSGGVSLGRAPFKGFQVTPTETGIHNLEMHIATKGISDLTELNRRILVQVTIPRADGTQEVLFSSTSGQWQDDSEAEWVNDSELTQTKLVLPLNITAIGALDVKIHYTLYSASGYVYIDPMITLTKVAEEE